MKNTEYWEQAAIDRMLAMEQDSAYTAEEILRLYDEALKDIEREIITIKKNFQKRFGLDNDKATFFLTKAQEEENLQSLIKALEEAPTPEAKASILKYIKLDGLSVRAYAARTERYEALKKEIYARMKRLDVDESNIIKQRLKEVYKEGYYGTIDEAAQTGITANFAMLNDRAIEEAVSHKWQGSRFSTRIWVHTDELAKKAQDIVIKSIITGASVEKTSRQLEKEFEVSKFRSTTLVRTETAHIMNEAQFKAYEEIGIEEYIYSATLDDRTCDICGALDRRTFKVSDRKEGLNAPVMHPRCRCTTVMASDKYKLRRVRNPETGKTYIISADTSYNEWYNGLSAEQKTAIKAHRNATSDKAQFERYKKVIGTKEVGRSLDKFQEMKYNDKERWEELKRSFRTINEINSKAWDDKFKKKAVTAYKDFKANNVEMSSHAISRFLSRGNKSVPIYSFDSIVEQNKKRFNYTQKSDRYIKYYDNVALVYNNKQNTIITLVVRNNKKADWEEIE